MSYSNIIDMKKYSYLFLMTMGLTLLSCKKHHDPVLRVSTLAGSGSLGFADGSAAAAAFHYPAGIAMDGQGNFYVADQMNHRIRKITSSGQVSTYAGDGTPGFTDGPAAFARFDEPSGVACDAAGNVYVADMNNNCIRKITTAGEVSTLAGNGTAGASDGLGAAASFDHPTGVACNGSSNIIVADYYRDLIRTVSASGEVRTLAGGTRGYADGRGTAARFNGCFAVTFDSRGNIYVAERVSERIRKISGDGTVVTLAGNGIADHQDGIGPNASFSHPSGIACDAAGNVYVADAENQVIRKITPAGEVSTYAGSGEYGSADDIAGRASFRKPYGVVCDSHGNIYVADHENNKIRKIILQ